MKQNIENLNQAGERGGSGVACRRRGVAPLFSLSRRKGSQKRGEKRASKKRKSTKRKSRSEVGRRWSASHFLLSLFLLARFKSLQMISAPSSPTNGVDLVDLRFAYGGSASTGPLLLDGFTLSLPPGARCLLVGANGAGEFFFVIFVRRLFFPLPSNVDARGPLTAEEPSTSRKKKTFSGKTTLLQVVAGHHMVPRSAVSVLGRPAFHDTSLVASGDLSYLGAAWRKDVAFAGYGVPLQGDLGAGEVLSRVPGVDPARRERLVSLLGIDPAWRLLRLSDGQRRRVQVAMGLLKPFKVLLLDEVTVDMDVLGRLDLLAFLAEECETRGAVVVYATHIFDGLQGWATHLAHVSKGKLLRGGPVSEAAPEMDAGTWRSAPGGASDAAPAAAAKPRKLLTVVEAWLRSERDEARAEKKKAAEAAAAAGGSSCAAEAATTAKRDPTPSFPSRQMAFFR